MKHYTMIAVASAAALLSTTALADVSSVKDMKNGAQVTISGTVSKVKNEREFTLRDNSGTIDVDIMSDQSLVLKKGDSVNVSGNVDKNLLSTDIDAASVTVNKMPVQAMRDAIEAHTSISLEGATSYEIRNLPGEGLVKVSGTVTDVDNEKKFTVKDQTGSIKIDVKSDESAAVTEGAEVTVIGYVDNGILGKDIDAQKVLVVKNMSRANTGSY